MLVVGVFGYLDDNGYVGCRPKRGGRWSLVVRVSQRGGVYLGNEGSTSWTILPSLILPGPPFSVVTFLASCAHPK